MFYRSAPSGVTPTLGAFPGLPCEVCGKPIARSSAFWCSRRCKDAAYNRAHPVARQRALPLEPAPAPVPPVRDKRPSVADRPRLVGHNLRVLDILRGGPVTNVQLAAMLGAGSAWRTRVSDVRLWLERHEGLTVKAKQFSGGIWNYRLEAIR